MKNNFQHNFDSIKDKAYREKVMEVFKPFENLYYSPLKGFYNKEEKINKETK